MLGLTLAHNDESTLKNSLLFNYDRTTPPGKVTVDFKFKLVDMDLCFHKQVLFIFYLLIFFLKFYEYFFL